MPNSHRISLTLFAILLSNFVQAVTNADEPPNILFISVDDLRPELKCYGATHMHTPNFDRLAADGIRFDNAYCQQAVCLPSRISLFTSMYPDATGVQNLQTHFRDTIPDAVTLTQHLRRSGYHTVGMGKVYHDEQPDEWDQWIDVREATGVEEYHLEEIIADQKRSAAEAKAKGLKGKALRRHTKGPATEAADFPDDAYEDGAMTRLAIEQIQSAGEKPFFLTVGFHRPHLPLIAPKKYWDLYDRESISLPANYFLPENAPQLAFSSWGELRAFSDIPQTGPLDDDKALEIIHGYYASVSFVDAQIGRLLDALSESGLDDNTMVVMWSDHGWKLGEHAMWCKHTNFEIDARVPLIVRMPKAAHGGRSTTAMVELVDLYPTLCEFAGVETPAQCMGRSVLPLLQGGESSGWREESLSQYRRARKKGGDITGYSIKTAEGRYTEWINLDSRATVASEFYDHRLDPDENRSTAKRLDDETAQSLSKRLHQRIEQIKN